MQKKILFVDDESSLRRTFSLGLSQRGYDMEPCENGVDALKKLEILTKNKMLPDAIVLDIQLPDILGTKLAKIIKFKYPDIPVVLITGYADKLNPEEINDLKVSAYLEKPFSPDELTEQFEQIISQQIAVEKAPVVEHEEDVSESGYLLVKLGDNADFIEVYKQLYFNENVLYCDATKGEYDMILLVQAPGLNQLRELCHHVIPAVKGVKEVDYLEVRAPILDDNINQIIDMAEAALSMENSDMAKARDLSNRVCSYVLMEVEREKLDQVYPSLRLNDKIVFCDYTTGKYNLVLMVHGTYFDEIDKFIQEKVIKLDGVLKTKEYPIINIFEM